MIYRELGKTGLKISQLGFGAMRLPMEGKGEDASIIREKAIPMLQKAFDGGVNYFDTAVGYCNKDSQRVVGEFLQLIDRKEVVVSTKNHYYGEDKKEWWQLLEDSLERLQTDYIDIYNHHGLNRQQFNEGVLPRVGKWMQEAKDKGLIRHICNSYHDNNDFLMELVDSGYPDVITLQYNILDRTLEEGIAYAKSKGIGIVGMGPVGGGKLGVNSEVLNHVLPEVKRIPELALRFVLSNENVATALSGMSTMEQVEENLAITSKETAWSSEEKEIVERHLEKLANMKDSYCTACGYCMPCKVGVKIPRVFELYNLGKVYGLWEVAKEQYNGLLKAAEKNPDRGKGADACIECGECEKKCPQNIPIINQLKEAHELLGE